MRKNEVSSLNDQARDWCEATGIEVKERNGAVHLSVAATGDLLGAGATPHAAVMAAFMGGTGRGFMGALHTVGALSFLGGELHDAFDDTWPPGEEDEDEEGDEDSEDEVHFERD